MSNTIGPAAIYLTLRIELNAPSIEIAHNLGHEVAEEICHTISFVSEASVRVVRPVYLIQWDRGIRERDLYAYGHHTITDPLDAIDEMFVRTVDVVSNHQATSATKSALRWFSRGNRAPVMEDRFLYYWFVMEVLAGAERISGKAVDKCPRCHQELSCTNPECGHPEHRPYDVQRIEILLRRFGMSEDLVRGVKEVRNLISHGADRAELIGEMLSLYPDFDLRAAVEIMRNYSQMALHRALNLSTTEQSLKFYHLEVDDEVTITQRSHLKVQTKGDPMNPRFEDVWLPTLTVTVTDPKTGNEETFGADGKPVT